MSVDEADLFIDARAVLAPTARIPDLHQLIRSDRDLLFGSIPPVRVPNTSR
jgi:hypothetical protein